jgi:histidinol-phosphate aminotransferase
MPISIHPAVASVPPYKPGKPAPVGPGGVSYKLSSNENPYPPLPGVVEAAHRAVLQMNRYPDMGNTELTAALADRHGVRPDELAFGTGSVAVLYTLLQSVVGEGDEVLYPWRSFEAYPIAVQLTGARSVQVPLGPGAVHDLDAMVAAITPATKVILVCTPNNPTGPIVDHDQLAAFVDRVPDHIMIVVDEAAISVGPTWSACVPSPRRTDWRVSGSATASPTRRWRVRSALRPRRSVSPPRRRRRPSRRCRPRNSCWSGWAS